MTKKVTKKANRTSREKVITGGMGRKINLLTKSSRRLSMVVGYSGVLRKNIIQRGLHNKDFRELVTDKIVDNLG